MSNTSILNFKKIVNLPLTDQKKEIDKISYNRFWKKWISSKKNRTYF